MKEYWWFLYMSGVVRGSSIVHDGWLSKGDDCDEVVSVWRIWIIWAFAVLVCSVNMNYRKKTWQLYWQQPLFAWLNCFTCMFLPLSDKAMAECGSPGKVSQPTSSDSANDKGLRGLSVSPAEGNLQKNLIVL